MTAIQQTFDEPAADDRHALLPCEIYQAWQAAEQDAEKAFRDWCAASPARRAERYAVYRAAADHEDAAADRWLAA